MRKKSFNTLALVLAIAGISFVTDYSVNKKMYFILGGINFGDVGVFLAFLGIIVAIADIYYNQK